MNWTDASIAILSSQFFSRTPFFHCSVRYYPSTINTNAVGPVAVQGYLVGTALKSLLMVVRVVSVTRGGWHVNHGKPGICPTNNVTMAVLANCLKNKARGFYDNVHMQYTVDDAVDYHPSNTLYCVGLSENAEENSRLASGKHDVC
jgi:hypothetical protein